MESGTSGAELTSAPRQRRAMSRGHRPILLTVTSYEPMASFYQPTPDPAARPASVRVQCEAGDCRALLEVAVVPDCHDGPLIVRCGSCQRLLEVNLSFGGGQGSIQGATRAHTPQNSFQMVKPPSLYPAHAQYRPHAPVQGGEHRTPLPMRHQLVQPPPLSRYHSLPTHQQGYCVGDEASPYAAHYASNVQQFGGSPYHTSTHFSGFDEHSPTARFQGIHENSYEGIRKRKKEKKSKPRNPSPYNLFMSREVKRIKAANPKLDHRVAFKQAANNWAKSPHNCSNQRVNVFGSPSVKVDVNSDAQVTEPPASADIGPSGGLDVPEVGVEAVKDEDCEDKANGPKDSENSTVGDKAPEQLIKEEGSTESHGVKRPLDESLPVPEADKKVKLDVGESEADPTQ